MSYAFSFPVLGFPVVVTWQAVILLAVIVFMSAGDGTSVTGITHGVLWGAVVFGSILVHELGHAVVGRKLGLMPNRILLHGFGGLCTYGRRPTPRQHVISGLAGPAAGLQLGVLAWVVRALVGDSVPYGVQFVLNALVWVNIFWSLFNLLPMYPMDGGQVLRAALTIKLGALKSERISRNLSIATAIPVGIIGYMMGFVFIPLIAVFAVFENLRR